MSRFIALITVVSIVAITREALMTATGDGRKILVFSNRRPVFAGQAAEDGANEEGRSLSRIVPHPDVVIWAKGPLHKRLEAVCAGYALHHLLSSKLPAGVPDTSASDTGAASSQQQAQQRPLRLAVLWLPDQSMPHATLNHVLGPLPPPSALSAPQGDEQDEQQQQQQQSTSFLVDSSDEALVLQHHPSWLNSPLYTYGTLNSRIPQAISQEQLQQQQEKQSGTFSASSSYPLPSAHRPRRLHVNFFLSSSLPPMAAALADVDNSHLHTSLQRCYSLLQPSTAVQELMAKENMTRVQQSTAVYMEPVALTPLSPLCTGCDPKLAVNCTTRRLMWFFLGQPDGDATVAGFWPSQALAVAHTFHPSRQPHLLRATLRRSALCRPNPAWGEALPPPIVPAEPTPRETVERGWLGRLGWYDGRAEADAEGGGTGGLRGGGGIGFGSDGSGGMEQGARGVGAWIECAQLEAAELFTLSAARGLIHLQHSPQAELIRAQASARGRIPRMHDVLVAPESFPRGAGGAPATVGGSSGGEGGEGGEGRVFEGERGLCHAPAIVPINKHRIGKQLIVDDTVGMVYCAVQKVGCTSWKVWIRQQHHHPNPNQLLDTHLPATSNVTEVWYSLAEPDAIRAITRTDYTRFVFVRQPFTRVVSAYLNKHVAGGGPDRFGRQFWTKKFFGQLWALRTWDALRFRANEGNSSAGGAEGGEGGAAAPAGAAAAGDAAAAAGGGSRNSSWWGVWKDRFRMEVGDLLSFEEFVRLLGDAWEEDRRWHLDEHIAPQNLLCGLDRIKYDYVGRFESMDRDVQALMERFGRNAGDAFDFGKKIHPTKSREQMQQMITRKATYDIIKRVYAMDMDTPLNNISYESPEELRKIYEVGESGQGGSGSQESRSVGR
ncbi:hypothetical protein CLOM_g7913 [Closterium sp. NIES-68]|nr:hypothetical protein CLOM_g7913 [Closterium sp. NIES-68]GJP58249.1 hypothetical protein CLOP_g22715 [Closterium sp. NIES-67]